MIKRILLLVIAAISLAACSKSDKETPNSEKGGNDKFLGTWVGTYDIIAENPEQQVRLVELLKEQHNIIVKTFNLESAFQKTRAVFSKNNNGTYSFKYFDETGKVKYGGINYTIKENKFIDTETNNPTNTYSFDGDNKLTTEMLGYFLFTIDAEKSNKELVAEIKKLNLDVTKPADVEKIRELTTIIQQKHTLRYKLKWHLLRQQ
ncbi:hypothetical protein [Capnocytophaga bilenii]|jgi:hypothetical protein